ncbi:MAG: ABC transporter permease [Clostridia bacterium]|nr:ABC transporter permease [Clostridia bacterium]
MKRIRIAVLIPALLCALLVILSLIKTHEIPALEQYVIDAPQEYEDIITLAERKEEALADMKEAVKASCVTAYSSGTDITSPSGSIEAGICAGTPGMFEVYPQYLLEGRIISETELGKGERVIVLGKALAFRLFPVSDAVGSKVKVNGAEYLVVGIVRDRGSIVSDNAYTAYIPLKKAEDIVFGTMILSVLPVPGSGANIQFRNTIPGCWIPGGDCYDLEKETMRSTLPVRLPVILACAFAIIKLAVLLFGIFRRWYDKLRKGFEKSYLTALLPQIILFVLSSAVSLGVCALIVWTFADWAVIPLKVFPEWVPDDPTSWNSILAVVRQMASGSAEKVYRLSAEVCVVRYWHTIISYAVIGMLSFGFFSVRRHRDC